MTIDNDDDSIRPWSSMPWW